MSLGSDEIEPNRPGCMQRGRYGIEVTKGGHPCRVQAIKIRLELGRVVSGGDRRDRGGPMMMACRLVRVKTCVDAAVEG